MPSKASGRSIACRIPGGRPWASRLDTQRITRVFQKGTYPDVDSYSAFFDNAKAHRRATGLAEYLQSAGVTDLYFLGLATNFCVAASTRDALGLGFNVSVLVDGCRGIDVPPQDCAAALADLRERGARLLKSEDLPAGLLNKRKASLIRPTTSRCAANSGWSLPSTGDRTLCIDRRRHRLEHRRSMS